MSKFHEHERAPYARALARLAALVIGVTVSWPVAAQEFVKVEDGTREQLPATPFVAAAYGFIWVAVLLYLFFVARGLGRVQNDLRDLRRRLDRGGSDAPANR